MTDNPLFSIITVTLNPGKDLADTVQSVLAQTFGDYELIIKDGGSTDGTEKLTWPDPRVQRHTSKDSGIFDAMNQALALVRGEYVNFLNAGDLFVDEQVLSDVAEAIRVHPGIPFFYGDAEKPCSRSGYEFYPSRLSRFFLFMGSVCHQAWFATRETYAKAGGFETERPTGADPRLLLKMMLLNRCGHRHVGRVVVRYRGNGVSAQFEHAKTSRVWCDELKRDLYRGWEYAVFTFIRNMVSVSKRLVYDTFLWRMWRRIQKKRVALRRGSRIVFSRR